MKFKSLLLAAFLLSGFKSAFAQEVTNLSLEQAVEMALNNSDQSKISEAQIKTAQAELNVSRNNQYPDFDISGQYMYLTNADVDLRLDTEESDPEEGEASPAGTPNIDQLLLGQANLSLPLFAGFKIKNSIKASENLFQAASFKAKNDDEQLALQTILDYLNLYKADQTIALVKENLKSTQQRVKDFSAMEENGLLARNDLLKAQLQESNVGITLEEAIKNRNILSYKLAVVLKLPENTVINTTNTEFGIIQKSNPTDTISRSDLEALHYQEQAAENQIKVAQSNYYPSISLSGGYIALDLNNALTVRNAMNIGVGLSYNLANIFKTKSDVKVAESRVEELKYTLDQASDQVKFQIENARQEYELELNKFQVYTKSEEQAIENYRIVKDKYDNGLIDTNDLLEADIQQLQAKIDLAFSRANITQKYYELLSARGQLTNQFIQ